MTVLFHLIIAVTVCILSWHEVMTHEIQVVTIPAKGDGHTCPAADLLKESLQLIRASVISSIANLYECGDGLWHRVAFLNMSDPLQQCPSSWREYNDGESGARACGRFDIGCPGVFYPIDHQYSKVCGRIIGYQVASPGAFHIAFTPIPPSSIDDIYVDGISVTYGSPRMHIWTFAAGVTEGTHGKPDCPCAVSDPPLRKEAPEFVGNNYYCESGNPNQGFEYGHFYGQDPLWDGKQCEGQCCSNGKSPPWFSVELASPTIQDIEVRICGDQDLHDEDNPITLLELFVQ